MSEHQPHYVWAFVVIVLVGIVAWIYTSNRPDENNYQKGSRHVEITENNYPLSLHPCGAIFKVDGELMKPNKK